VIECVKALWTFFHAEYLTISKSNSVDIHSVAMNAAAFDEQCLLCDYFTAYVTLEKQGKLPLLPTPKLLSLAGKGEAGIFALFGGQGTNEVYFNEPQLLFNTHYGPFESLIVTALYINQVGISLYIYNGTRRYVFTNQLRVRVCAQSGQTPHPQLPTLTSPSSSGGPAAELGVSTFWPKPLAVPRPSSGPGYIPFVESQGSGVQVLMSLATALEMDCPIQAIVACMDLHFRVNLINVELFTDAATSQESLHKANLAKSAINGTDVKFKMLSNSAMKADVALKSFTVSDTRSVKDTKFREIIPAVKHNARQFVLNYRMSAGANASSLALVTVDSPNIIFSLDAAFALMNFFMSAFPPAPAEASAFSGKGSQQAKTSTSKPQTKQDSSPPSENTMAFRVHVLDPTIILLAAPKRADTEAIVLSIKQFLLGVLALKVDQMGMLMRRMNRPKESSRFPDDFEVTTVAVCTGVRLVPSILDRISRASQEENSSTRTNWRAAGRPTPPAASQGSSSFNPAIAHPLCCAYSYSSKAAEPSAQWLAIGDNEGRIILLNTLDDSTADVFTGPPQWRVTGRDLGITATGPTPLVFELAWRQDDVLLASSASNYSVAVWDVSTHACTDVFAGPQGSARSIQL
ncbi:unnamed protein product, partial [Tilletia laevis]